MANRVLLILLLTYIFNLLDRQIIGILAIPLKADLQLSDTQLGLMGGVAFALFYSLFGLPIAWLADRKNRVIIIGASVGLWSAFTALCGFSQNFWQIFLCRIGVGISEAGGVAPAHSLISDYFPPDRRARALAIFALGGPLGAALGIFFGGWIASNINWRAAFLIVGAAGMLLAPLVLLGAKEVPRGRFEKVAGASPPAASASAVARRLASTPSIWLLGFAAAAGSIPSYGMLFWLPSYFVRSLNLSVFEASLFQGSIMLVAGVFGTWFGGFLADRLGKSNRAAYALVPGFASLLAGPTYALAISTESVFAAWFLFLIPQALGLIWFGPVIAASQQVVPPNMRASTSASVMLINNLGGIALGTWLLGFMSDRMTSTYGDDALRYSILYSLPFFFIAFLLYLVLAWRIPKDWYADHLPEAKQGAALGAGAGA